MGADSMKRIYIAGCGGMLGEAFYEEFKHEYNLRCTDIDLNSPWLSYLDFRDYDAYKKDVEKYRPDLLFHLGAFTDLEYCEENPDQTYLTNTISVENAVYIANSQNIPLVYISTAGIFNGSQASYDDWDAADPLGVYARSKYMGERFVVENAKQYLICRAGWMMGGGPQKDKKFVQKIMQQIKAGAKEIFVVNDKDGTPTYTHDFAKNVKHLLQKEFWGLYNMVCGGQTSRLEVAQFLVKTLNKDREIKITEVSSEYFKDTYYAMRPGSERLINRKLDLRNMNDMRDWRIALKEYIAAYYNKYL